MERIINFSIAFMTGILVLAVIPWLVWVFILNIQEADPSIKAGLIALMGMLAVTLITHYQVKKREANARHFSDKRKGYLHMINLIFDFIQATKNGVEIKEDEFLPKYIEFKKALMVWGSSEVIELWNNYEIEAGSNDEAKKMIQRIEDILRAVRKDLGHDDSSLKGGSLVALILQAQDKGVAFDASKP